MFPLGIDKCVGCDKELGDGMMQSVSSHCHSPSDPPVDMNVSCSDVQRCVVSIFDLHTLMLMMMMSVRMLKCLLPMVGSSVLMMNAGL